MPARAAYKLYYWPGLQGRGEFVRLAFEDAGVAYDDVVRLPKSEGGGVPALLHFMSGEEKGNLPFGPPILQHGSLVIAQTALILHYLGPRLGLVGESEPQRLYAHQLQLTIADFISEVHDTHHPIASGLYYEEQKPEAKKRTAHFLAERMPKYLGYFASVLERGGGKYLVGRRHSYVDLSMFQVVSGLEYAFPKSFERQAKASSGLLALRDKIAARPRLAAYLESPRRVPFNEQGIFRHYPELEA